MYDYAFHQMPSVENCKKVNTCEDWYPWMNTKLFDKFLKSLFSNIIELKFSRVDGARFVSSCVFLGLFWSGNLNHANWGIKIFVILSRATKRSNYERPISWQRANTVLSCQTPLDPDSRTSCWKSLFNKLR